MNIANVNELNYFLDKYPSVSMMEVLMVDINGIIRCKRIPRSEFEELFTHGIKGPASTVLLNVKGEFCDEPPSYGVVLIDGDQLTIHLNNFLDRQPLHQT